MLEKDLESVRGPRGQRHAFALILLCIGDVDDVLCKVKACAVDVPASSIDEKLKQLRASVSCLEGSMGELEAEQGRLRASSRKLHAAAQVKQCETKKLVDELRREARMSKYLSSVVHRGEHAFHCPQEGIGRSVPKRCLDCYAVHVVLLAGAWTTM